MPDHGGLIRLAISFEMHRTRHFRVWRAAVERGAVGWLSPQKPPILNRHERHERQERQGIQSGLNHGGGAAAMT